MDRRVIAQFWGDCRAGGPLEVWSAAAADAGGGVVPEGRDVPYPFAVIGRDPRADYHLGHGDVSRHHAYVQVIGGRIFWLDLGSRSGIAHDDMILPSGWLEPGGSISVGPYLVRARVGAGGRVQESPDPVTSPLTDRGPSSWPGVYLEFPDRPGRSGRRRLGRVLTLVGRATGCRIRISDDAISRFHCALLRTPGGLWAVDLLSREGVRVDGTRVRCARVGDGASLYVGRYRMIARYTDAPAPGGEDLAWEVAPLEPDQLPAVATPRRPPARASEPPIVERPPSSLAPADLEPFIARFEQMQQQMFEQFHQAMMTMFQSFGAMHRDQMGQVREELDRIRELTRELQTLQAGEGRASRSPDPGPGSPATPREEPRRDRPASPWPRSSEGPEGSPGGDEIHDLISQRVAKLQGERQGRWKRVLDLISGGTQA